MTTGAERFLIVNADDFGQSPGVNRGIIEAHEHGIVTSASLMVRCPAAVEAAEYSRAHRRLGLGLHVDLGEWRRGAAGWEALYQRIDLDDRDAVAAEIDAQIDLFRQLTGKPPTHVDSHQHVHLRAALRPLFAAAAERLAAPLRHCVDAIRYCGDFYGQAEDGSSRPQAIGAEALVAILQALRPGVTELACHPGRGGDLDTMYRAERDREVDTLCAPSIRSAVERLDLRLCSFENAPAAVRNTA
jgi:predicted glycoside hydrolase/deacetylase ChbG (UPF0249 family)